MAVTGLVAALAGGSTLAAALQPKTLIVPQPNSPIQITVYNADRLLESGQTPEGISHRVSVRNRSKQRVVAFSIGLVSFDVFDRFMRKVSGIEMDELGAGRSKEEVVAARAQGSSTFYTGIAYIESVRFEDGTIWRSDEAGVIAVAVQIEKTFEAKLLRDGAVVAAR
jgi:hypothetical protein